MQSICQQIRCDFIMKNNNKDYAYTQISYTIPASEKSENREYRPLEMIV